MRDLLIHTKPCAFFQDIDTNKSTRKAPGAAKKNTGGKKVTGSKKTTEKIYATPPLDLPLSDTWFHFSDLMERWKMTRGVVQGMKRRGILVSHLLGTSLRYNLSYAKWIEENGLQKKAGKK